jgi:hypothetical protein
MTRLGLVVFSVSALILILVILLSVLRFCGVISTSFFWILAPIWFPVCIMIIMFAALGGLFAFPFMWDSLFHAKNKGHF